MKKLLLVIYVLLLAGVSNVFAQKVVGYVPSYRPTSSIQYTCLTQVNYAFINPNTNGTLITTNVGNALWNFNMTHFLTIRSNCKPVTASGPDLMISVGGADAGGQRSSRLNSVSGNATYRATFVQELVNFAITHGLSGIDIDWEFPTNATMRNNHEALLAALRTEINNSSNPNLKISIAVGGEYTNTVNHLNYINSTAIQYVDDVQIMAYDFPASYSTNHSSYVDADGSIQGWNTIKGVPKSKMILGVPFYGRNAGRSAESEYNTFSPGTQAVYDNDYYAGWYYNGCNTLEQKIDLIMTTHGGQGIMIWDMGQDRTTTYSLQDCICNKMASICPVPQPDLGSDQGLCPPSTINLDPGVPAASGRTFVWKRNGVTIGGANGTTYTASQGGTYTVEISQGPGCTRTDEIEIIEGGGSLLVSSDERCGAGVVNLAITSPGGPFEWYDAATGGSLVNTGATYSPNIATTTTYYVQESTGSASYTGGKAVIDVGTAWNENADQANALGHYAHEIVVSQDLTINSIDFWSSGNAMTGAVIQIISSLDGQTVLQTSPTFNIPASTGPHTMPVNLTLTPGTYFVTLYVPGAAGGGGNPGIWMEPNSTYASSETGVFSIDGNVWVNWGGGFTDPTPTVHYGQLFNWNISTGVAPPCGRTAVTGTINTCTPPSVTLTNPSEPGPQSFVMGGTINLTSSVTDDGTITQVQYVIRDGSSAIIATVSGGPGPTYTAPWTPPGVDTYTITAEATDDDGLVGSSATVTLDVILPVTLLDFTAVQVNGGVLLHWTTSSEDNNSHFEIERSGNGERFEVIGQVTGNGNSTVQQSYSFVDNEALNGLSYYRLKQVDYDGSVDYSPLRSVTLAGNSGLDVYPNPSTGDFSVVANPFTEVAVYNTLGQVVSTGTTDAEGIVSFSILSKGVYTVKAISGTNSEAKRLVIE